MKKLLFFLVSFWLLQGIALAQTVYTPRLNLALPPAAPGTWGEDYNNNFVILDSATSTLGLTCTDGQVPTWAAGRFSVCGSGGGGGHVIEEEGTPLTARSNLNFAGAGVSCADSGGKTVCTITGSALSVSGTGLMSQTSAGVFATRDITGASGNISITSNPGGVAGNPVIDLGATAVQTDQSNTYTTGDQDFGSATSLGLPRAAGASPTTPGRCAFDLTAQAYKCGLTNGTTITLAPLSAVQPIHANLTALSGLTGVSASVPRFTGPGAMSILALPTCTDTGGNHWNFDGTSITCGTSSSGGLTGGTVGTLLKYATATTATNSILTEAAGVVTVGGGLVVGSGPFLLWDTSAIATSDKTWTIINQSGTMRPSTGALTPGNIVTTNANGLLVDGGAAGAGTWTDSSTNTGTNKTFDEATNVFKVTKSVQVELFGPTDDNTSGNGKFYYRVPVSLNGTNLTGIQANVVTAGTTGTVGVQITRCAAVATTPLCSGTTASMLSTTATIDSGETSTSTAATAAVINAANDDVATGQILRFDLTAIHTTPAKGLFVNLDFKLP